MTETTKPLPKIIVVTRARLSFARIHKAEKKRNPQGQEYGVAQFSATLLLDPSNVQAQKDIAAIKAAAFDACIAQWGSKENFPKADPRTGMGALILPFGNGNDLRKIYDGYKDMFYVKVGDTTRPLLGNRKGEPVVEGDPQCPYGGCYVRARISPWTYFPTAKNPQKGNGVNFNLRSLQFVEDGPGFGGGGSRSAEEEFEQMIGDAPKPAPEGDPFG